MKKMIKINKQIIILIPLLITLIIITSSISMGGLITGSSYGYNPISKIMTDNNGLEFQTEPSGVITIDNDRFLAFALTGKVGGSEYTYTSMDFNWDWSIEQNGDDYIFYAVNDHQDFVWEQFYYFSPKKPMKLEHKISNNLADISDVQMFYLLSVENDDLVEFNNSSYLVGDVIPQHFTGDFSNLNKKFYFNEEYLFGFEDIYNEGFMINEFYLGNASVIGYPSFNMMAVGFTKNNGFFPKGTSVVVDPIVATRDIESISSTPLDDTTEFIAYCDETPNDFLGMFRYLNGTNRTSEFTIDSNVLNCFDVRNQIGTDCFNDTTCVACISDQADTPDEINSYIIDVDDGLVKEITVATVSANSRVCDVVVVDNETGDYHVGWYDDGDVDDILLALVNINGTIVKEVVVDNAVTSGDLVALSRSNTTQTEIIYNDDTDNDMSIKSYDNELNDIYGEVDLNDNCGNGNYHGASFNNNNSLTISSYYCSMHDKNYLRGYDPSKGTLVGSEVTIGDVGSNSYLSMSKVNESRFVVAQFNSTTEDIEYKIYNMELEVIIPLTTLVEINSNSVIPLSVSSRQEHTGLGFCSDMISFTYAAGDSSAGFLQNTTSLDGSVASGNCLTSPVSIRGNGTSPTEGINFSDSFLVWADLFDDEGDVIEWNNFSVMYPNGTLMLDNINGSHQTYTNSSDINWTSSSLIADDAGTYIWWFNTSDGFEITNSLGSFFVNDTSVPVITVDSPSNNSVHIASSFGLNTTILDDIRVNSCWYEFENVTGESLLGNSSFVCGSNITVSSLPLENFNIIVYSNDSLNNLAYEKVNVSVTGDTSSPNITIGSLSTSGSAPFTLTANPIITDNVIVDTCIYSVSGANTLSNSTFNCTTLDTGAVLNTVGSNNLSIWANDSSDQWTLESSSFTTAITPVGDNDGGGGGGRGGDDRLGAVDEFCTANSDCITGLCDLSTNSDNYRTCQLSLCGNGVCEDNESPLANSCPVDCNIEKQLREGTLLDSAWFLNIAMPILVIIAILLFNTKKIKTFFNKRNNRRRR